MVSASRAIARDSRSATLRFPDVIVALAQHLGEFPMMGLERPEIVGPPYRFVAVHGFPHLVVYDARQSPPLIMRIVHGAQDLPAILHDLPRQDV
jgi:toxin ParE1/3/4